MITGLNSILSSVQRAGIKRFSTGVSMARHTSWKIGGPADYLCTVEQPEELLAAVAIAREHGLPWLVLGGGNNILVADAGIEGLVILNRLRGLAIDQSSPGATVVCGAGVFFAKAAHYTARHGFTGMEWGIAIPGTVGAGVVSNAGAHASDVSRSLVRALALDGAGHLATLSVDDLAYRYRHSVLKTPHAVQTELVVTECTFRVAPGSAQDALDRIEHLRQRRLRTQPVKEATAGSTFTNPPGEHAGALIERAGLKGRTIGGAQISPLHANFIVNTGNATAADVLKLMSLARSTIEERFGIALTPEVQFVGRWQREALAAVIGSAA